MLYMFSDVVKSLTKFALISILIIISSLVILSLIISTEASASDYHSNYERLPAVERSPPRVGNWKYTPTVLVCSAAPVDEVRTRSSVAFWENLGYKFYTTIYKQNHLNKCTSENPQGFIVVKLVSQEEIQKMKDTTLAQTHFYVDINTGKIEWAIIYLRTEPTLRVLEHEIGHALGYLHYNKPGHLMHKSQPLGGWDTDGLHK
ncbi:hypothetical protein CL634_05705 [bacterium]|nr:hypothetical protein [bacterium]